MGRLKQGLSYWVKNTFVELGVPAADDLDAADCCRERRAWSADLAGDSVLQKFDVAKEGPSKEAHAGESEECDLHEVPHTPSPLFHPAAPAGNECGFELALPPSAGLEYGADGSVVGFAGQGPAVMTMMYDENSGQLLPCSWCVPMEGFGIAGEFGVLPIFDGQDPSQQEGAAMVEFDPALFDGSGFGQMDGCHSKDGEANMVAQECFDLSGWEEHAAWEAQAGAWEQMPEHTAEGDAAAWNLTESQHASEAASIAKDGGKRKNRRRKAEEAAAEAIASAGACDEDAVKATGSTTVMLRNIPNKYSRDMLVQQLNEEFRGEFDFVYLPIDFKNGCNVGYGFINFRTPELCEKFVSLFDGVDVQKCLPGLNSRKVIQVTPARVQGLEDNVRRLRSSPVMNELVNHEDWMPVLLDEYGNWSPLEPADQPLPPVRPRRRGGNGNDEAGDTKPRAFR